MYSLSYYGRRALSGLHERSRPVYNLKSHGHVAKIPGGTRDASRLIRDWSANWKTHAISTFLREIPGAFLDVGCNIGQTLVDFHVTRGPQHSYYGFEPNPASATMVRGIIAVNGMEGASVLPIGLSDRDAMLKLFVGQDNGTDPAATLVGDLRPAKALNFVWVPCKRLDDVLPDVVREAPALIKIDVEGAESQVIAGMTRTLSRHRPPILCEVLHRNQAADAARQEVRNASLMATLREVGYAVFNLVLSEDEQKIADVREVERFPDKVWDRSSPRECEYVFMPRDGDMPDFRRGDERRSPAGAGRGTVPADAA